MVILFSQKFMKQVSFLNSIFSPKYHLTFVMSTIAEQNLVLIFLIRITAWKVSVFGVFLVRIFPHLDWIRRDTPNLSVFCQNSGKYGPEKLGTRPLFTQWVLLTYLKWFDHLRDCSINTVLFSFQITSKFLFQFYWIPHQHYSIDKNMLQYFLQFIISKIALKLSGNIGV